MSQGVSTFRNITNNAACLRQNGHRFVVRYYSSSDWKRVAASEAQAIFQAGLQLVVVFENGPASALPYPDKVAYFTAARGAAHGAGAYAYARDVMHQREGSAIYFAVDFDVERDSEINSNIKPYFEAVQQAFNDASNGNPAYRIGVYGSGAVCKWLNDRGHAALTWLAESTGWRGYQSYKDGGDWALLQIKISDSLCGLTPDDYEMNESNGDDFGAFGPAEHSHFLAHKALALPAKAKTRASVKKIPAKKAGKAKKGAAKAMHPLLAHWFGGGAGGGHADAVDGPHGDPVANGGELLNLWQSKRGEQEYVKIIAIRGGYNPDSNKLGLYDDKLLLCIGTSVTEWRGSTDPGLEYLANPINSAGCAQLCEGVHYFKTGMHHSKYPAFVQAESFHVNRLNADGQITQVQFGDFAIHLHSGGAGMDVGEFSAGCQIIQCPEGYFGATWDKFYKAITDAMDDAKQSLLPYMLISQKDSDS